MKTKTYEKLTEEKEPSEPSTERLQVSMVDKVKTRTVDEVMEHIGVECLEVEWGLTEVQKSSLTSVVFVGQLFGSYFWGPFADKKGRKIAYLSALTIIVIAGYGSAFARDFFVLAGTRFFVGFGVGAIHIPFDIMAEFLPSSIRGNFLLGIQFFWSLGNVVVTMWAWLVLGPYGWRVMAFGCAVPMNISLVGAFFMPESPRWLVSQGRTEEAKQSLLYAANMNGTELKDFQLVGRGDKSNGETEESLMDLFSVKYLKLNSLVWTVWFCYGFVYYGIILFTTRLFAHDHDDDDTDDDKTCHFDYLHLMISAVIEFIALFFVLLGMEIIARNLFQSLFYGLSAAFCLLLAFFDTSTILITMFSSLIRLAVRGGLTVTWLATPELYPTHIRSSGHAIASSMVRLAGVVCPFLASNNSVSEAVVCFVLSVVSIFASMSAFFTPDSRYFDLDENCVEEAERNSSARLSGESERRYRKKSTAGSSEEDQAGCMGSWESLLPPRPGSSF